MTEYNRALYRFWSQFEYGGSPVMAYKAGHVPDDAVFPYVTFQAVEGAFFSSGMLTAFAWCRDRDGVSANSQRAALLDDVSRAIPAARGAKLKFDGGLVTLHRNDGNFLSDYDDPDNAERPEGMKIIGGRISYEARFYCF